MERSEERESWNLVEKTNNHDSDDCISYQEAGYLCAYIHSLDDLVAAEEAGGKTGCGGGMLGAMVLTLNTCGETNQNPALRSSSWPASS